MPAIPVEHQFIVMDQDPALGGLPCQGGPEHPVIRDADAQSYVREERGGWILGVYEKNAPARFEYGVPDSFRADLFPLDLERIEEQYMAMIHRFPCRGKRAEGRFQRADLLHAGRQPSGWAGARAAQHVVGRRVLFWDHCRRRHGVLPGPNDGGRRGRDRHGVAGPQALR